jgi:sporulation protein YlmC with PRC-barrel domain
MPKYKTIDGRTFNVKVEDVNSFTSRFPNATLVEESGWDADSSLKKKELKAAGIKGVWAADIPLKYKLRVSTVALVDGLRDPVERAEIIRNAQNIKHDLPFHLINAWESSLAMGVDFLRGTAGEQATDFMIAGDLGNVDFIDPNTKQMVSFDDNPEKWKELSQLGAKMVYRDTGEEVGNVTDVWLANKYKEIEATKLIYRYDAKGMVKGFKTGDVSDVVGGVMNSVSSMIETVGPAILTRGASLFPQIAAPMYVDYNTAKAKSIYGEEDPDAIEKLVVNNESEVAIPLALGALATGLEYIGLKGVTRYMASIPGKSAAVGKLIWVGNGEGATELGQLGLETMNSSLGAGKSIEEASIDAWDAMASDEGLEMYLSGFIGSTTMSSSGRLLNRALRSDNASIKEVNEKIDNIAKLNHKKYSTKSKGVKDAIDLEIQEAEKDLRDYINEKRNLKNTLSDNERTSLIDVLNEKDGIKLKVKKLKSQLEAGEINSKEFGYAIRSLNNQDKRLSSRLSEIQSTAVARAAKKITETVRKQVGVIAEQKGVEGTVTEASSQEIIDLQGETLARLRAERDANQEILEDPNQTAENKEVAEANVKELNQQVKDVDNDDLSYGYIDEKVDSKGNLTGDFEIIINKDKPMLGTAAHEFLHKVLFKTLKGNKQLQDKIGDALIDFINNVKGGASEAFIDRMGAYIEIKKDKDGNIVKDKDGNVQYEKVSEFGEETMTVLSESLIDGTQKYNEGLVTRLGDLLRQTLQRYGLRDIKFDEGKDIYNFIKDYNRSIEKGYTSKAITKAAVEGIKGKLVEGKKKAKPKAKRKMSKVSPKAKAFLETKDEEGKLMFTNEMLVDIINAKRSTQEDKFSAVEALIEKNWPVISKALKFNPTGDITMESVKTAISEQMLGIFPEITLPNGQTVNREGKFLLNTYNKENTVTTFLDNTLRPRQAEIFTRAKMIDAVSQGVNLEEAKNIAISTELENETSNQQDTRKRVNVLKIPKVAKVAKEIRQDTKVVEGDTHKQVTKNNEGHIGNKIFNVPENKITKPKDNLTTSDDIVDVKTGEVITKEELDAGATGILSPSESKNIQDVFSDYETSEQFIKILPKTNVSEKDALVNEVGENIPVSRNVYGRAIGLQDRILEYFYEPLMKPNGKRARSQGKTSQVPLWTLKEEFINPKKDVIVQFQRDLGITEKKQINILPTKEKRSEIGQLLKGAARTLSQQVALSAAQRNLEAIGAPKQQIADITAGQRKRAYSKESINRIKDLALNTDKLKWLGEKIKLANRTEQYLETKEDGKIKGEVIIRKHLNELQDEKNKITWEEFYMNQLLDFFETYPQYYNVIRTSLTGGVKKAAFFNVGYFKDAIKIYAKKNNKLHILKTIKETKQIEPKRLPYHAYKRWKGLANLDLSKDDGKLEFLINIYSDISKHVSKDGRGKEIFQEILTHFGIDQSNFMRHSARVIGHPVNPKTGKNYKIIKDGKKIIKNENPIGVEEHAVQMEMARIMMGMAFDGNIKDAVKILKAVYSQISLRESEDPSGPYRKSMGKDFYNNVVPRILDGSLDFLPDGYVSIYRLMKAGVNPFGYKLIDEKQTIAEFFGVNNLSIEKARQTIIDIFEEKQDIKVLRAQSGIKYSKNIDSNKTLAKATSIARTRSYSKQSKGITVLDFDDTLATTKSLVRFTAPDGTTGTLNAEEYASTYQDLLEQGYTFDFSEFNKVVKGKIAPLFQKALKLQGKFGPENMFVLTARPPAAQKAIFDFLKANGLNIPLKNITGLGNSTSEAKALWIADKVGEGYNDFYFADDALQNVQAVDNMLSQFDVKRKIQQAKVKFSKDVDTVFNDILQDVSGIKSEKRYSAAKARKRGEGKGRFRIFVPPSHEDFVGLLYNFIGKGEIGNKHREFFEEALIKPLNRAYTELNEAKQSIANDYKSLIKQFPDVRKKLTKKTPDGDYLYSDAIRVYLWDKFGFEIPGMTKTDIKTLVDLVEADVNLQSFAEAISLISREEQGYVAPNKEWEIGDIRTDLADATTKIGRQKFFKEFIENADIIFSEANLNKIEAIYGKNFREALEDILYRTKNGTNRRTGSNRLVNRFVDYINGSVGATMFVNVRSAVLQTLSMVNFINYADNNIFKAAIAFANQPQYWKDFTMIFNSDMLKQRRAGIAFDVNANELASAISKSKQPFRAAMKHLLQLGFLPTQIADSFAIASGGATFYRNRVNTYLKQGLSQKEAEEKAFNDFQELAEMTQQSARPDMISQQQASPLGKLILAFQNTPSQYNRIIKKATLDLINRRKRPPYKTQWQSDMSNLSRILYYGGMQNIIFYSLQSALFAMLFSDDEEDEEFFKKKQERILSGSIDTILRGMGVGGAIISTVKNTIIKLLEKKGKNRGSSTNVVVSELLQLSPPIGIKARKLEAAERTYNWNKDVISEMETFNINNPVWSVVSNTVEATTNLPANRVLNKTLNIDNALDNRYEYWQRIFMLAGWNRWNLGAENYELEEIKKEIKERTKQDKKERKKQDSKFKTKKFKKKKFKKKIL